VIKVSVEVNGRVASFTAAVWAESIEQAISLARACYPGCEASVLFPIDAEAYFAKDDIPMGIVWPEAPKEAAG
jgi:hypothetical protein